MAGLMIILGTFVGLMFITQIVFFEISRNKVLKAHNYICFMSFDKPFSYHRYGYMFVLCLICYVLKSPGPMFTMDWFLNFVLFLALGIVGDILVQYLSLVYAKVRCRSQIEEGHLLENELQEISQTMYQDFENIEEEVKSFEEIDYLKKYFTNQSHLAYICVDQGKFVKEHGVFNEATFDVEPYSDLDLTRRNLEGTPVQVTQLTSSNLMPFKDDKLDIVMCQYSNYDKLEVQRVLKRDGLFIVHQNGTSNFKEFLQMYMPYGMKGTWDAFSCAQTLEDIGMHIVDKVEDYRTVRFRSLQAIHTYFMKYSPDLADINKYKVFYMNALKSIKEHSFYELTTHQFLVVAKKA